MSTEMCGTCSDHFVLPATFCFRALEFLARDPPARRYSVYIAHLIYCIPLKV